MSIPSSVERLVLVVDQGVARLAGGALDDGSGYRRIKQPRGNVARAAIACPKRAGQKKMRFGRHRFAFSGNQFNRQCSKGLGVRVHGRHVRQTVKGCSGGKRFLPCSAG
jgi:hypothetical protein